MDRILSYFEDYKNLSVSSAKSFISEASHCSYSLTRFAYIFLFYLFSIFFKYPAHRYYVYAMVDNRYNTDILLSLKQLNKDVPMYFENPDVIRVGKSGKRMLRIPVIFLKKAQPDQLQGVVGLFARKPSGQALLIGGQSMIPMNLVSETSSTGKEPTQITMAPDGE